MLVPCLTWKVCSAIFERCIIGKCCEEHWGKILKEKAINQEQTTGEKWSCFNRWTYISWLERHDFTKAFHKLRKWCTRVICCLSEKLKISHEQQTSELNSKVEALEQCRCSYENSIVADRARPSFNEFWRFKSEQIIQKNFELLWDIAKLWIKEKLMLSRHPSRKWFYHAWTLNSIQTKEERAGFLPRAGSVLIFRQARPW